MRFLSRRFFAFFFVYLGLLLVAAALAAPGAPAEGQSPLHPDFPLLDAAGLNVLDSGEPVSTMNTCGACHDTDFIAEHSFHTDLGLSRFTEPGQVEGGQPWDSSPGFFGNWNPMNYRYLSPAGDERLDLTTPEWLMRFGARHVGGGPAEFSRDGTPLTELDVLPGDPETHIVDPASGELREWDWNESGVVEMNCFLCHLEQPDNDARVAALEAGDFGWANTATLLKTGVVEQAGSAFTWNEEAFDREGRLQQDFIGITDPTNDNCGQCHGLVHIDAQTPLVMEGCDPTHWNTITTGEIISPQRLSQSGLNLTDKAELTYAWDVHAERVLDCTDCHYSLNNPVTYREDPASQPGHLTFDPRRLDFGDYLQRPLHQFAKGDSAQGGLAPQFDNSLRRCESCHSIEDNHEWLPYKERHTSVMACETCHVPELFGPARQYNDWTVVQRDGSALTECRSIEHVGPSFSTTLLAGYEPTMLIRKNGDGEEQLSPYNLVTSWYWVYGDPPRPVALRDLQAAWLAGDDYHPEVLAVFDENRDGLLLDDELFIETDAEEEIIRQRLAASGLENPRIEGEVRPYRVNHAVVTGEQAVRDCQACHSRDSRLTGAFELADRIPGDVMPAVVVNPTTRLGGEIVRGDDGRLYYEAQSEAMNLYVFGHDNVPAVDWAGAILFLATLLGVATHGGLRVIAARRNAPREVELRREYMYSIYERQWHWLQTFVILGLLLTGLVIHRPDMFSIFGFRYMVIIHNILAVILVINAALAAFYHLASGEIRQYLPRPRGFFNQAFEQASFYLRGIFQNEEHPFEKTPERKLNPLQQMTYLMILNVLLPLQVITGGLLWGAQEWPAVAEALGGLPVLAPLHTLVAWLFASFIVLHVYLTTTGHTPLAGIRAMMLGWDEVEAHPAAPGRREQVPGTATTTTTTTDAHTEESPA